tara:strand:- start:3 stop:1637 length:1635 start_codon:yes stop_codon:yes gene_type:complete
MRNLKQKINKAIFKALKLKNYPNKNFTLSPPKIESFGHLSSNIALLLSKEIKKSPLEIAEGIAEEIRKENLNIIKSITVSKPGFINFKIVKKYFQDIINSILEKKDNYGNQNLGLGKTANVEFVSANPTGPLTIGHGRNAIIGDTISNILEWHGYDVTREYYYNDAGKQMRMLSESVKSRYYELINKTSSFPSEGYQGDYIKEIARNLFEKHGELLEKKNPIFGEFAENEIFNKIKNTLNRLNINFNVFSNEKSFYESGAIKKVLKNLKEKKLIYEKDNATWFKASEAGGIQDRVYIKSTGELTYRLPDTAYHIDKVNRQYDLIIDVFGADHADAYPDVINALTALDINTSHIKVLIYQFVTLLKSGEKVKMSTRKGEFVTLDTLLNEVGLNATRYFFIMRSMNSHLDFDLDLAKDESEKNPVFYLQYAHARICNIIARSLNAGYKKNMVFETKLLDHEDEIRLLIYLSEFSDIMELALETLEPQILVNYLQKIASQFHRFYGKCRVIVDDENLSKSRIALIKSVQIVLSNGLSIIGIEAPKKM